jgi:hypothetical protein
MVSTASTCELHRTRPFLERGLVRRRGGSRGSGFWRLLLAVALVLAAEGSASGQAASLDGKWTATALTASWNVGEWGAACGPRPSGGGEPGGTATVAQTGNELVISGVGRTYRTTECWEQFPGLSRTGHTAATRSWRTSCKSPATDPRQAKIVTTVTATDDQIIFDETGAYQFIIQGQNCTASVRRSRFFRRIKTASGASTAVTRGPAAPASGTPSKQPACAKLGPAARIELRPSRKLMRPGERFTFRAAVVDAKGCALGVAPAFRLPPNVVGITLSGSGTVTVAKDAPEADVKLTVTLGGRAVEANLQIVSGERFDALLARGGFDETGASADAAVTRLESGSVGARSTVIEDDSGRRRTLFVGVVGGAAVLLGIMGLVLVRRSRRAPPSTRSGARAAPAPAVAPQMPRGTFCPTCREEYPPAAQFCPTDGNRLLPIQQATNPLSAGSVCPVCGQGFDPGVTVCPKHDEPLVPPAVYAARNAPAPVVTRKICPVCGTQYGGESQFCGQCGASLVPVN